MLAISQAAARAGVPVKVEKVGGGLNFGCPKFLDFVHRLTRFDFSLFERSKTRHGCRVLVLNDGRLAPERETVEDLLTIVHGFSNRLHGLRNDEKHFRQSLAGHEGADAL